MTSTAEISERDAVHAMRERGLSSPEELLPFAAPAVIVRTCHWWDGLQGVRPGLLAKRIRDGGVEEADVVAKPSPDRRPREMRERFERLAASLSEGAVLESHRSLQLRRRDEDELCGGRMVVGGVSFPVLEAECDECGLLFGYTLRALGRVQAT